MTEAGFQKEVATAYSEGYLRGQEVLRAEITRARPPSLEWDGIWAKSPTHNFFWEVNFGTLAVNYDYEWAQTVNIAECADEAAAKTLAAELQAVLDRYSEKTPPYNAYEGLTEMEDLPGGGFRIFRSAPKESE